MLRAQRMVRRDLSTGVASGGKLRLRFSVPPLEVTKVTSYISDSIRYIDNRRLAGSPIGLSHTPLRQLLRVAAADLEGFAHSAAAVRRLAAGRLGGWQDQCFGGPGSMDVRQMRARRPCRLVFPYFCEEITSLEGRLLGLHGGMCRKPLFSSKQRSEK